MLALGYSVHHLLTASADFEAFLNPLGVSGRLVLGTSGKPAAKEAKKKSDAEEITGTLTRRYARILKFYKEWDNEDVMQVYLNALAHVYDPHSDYLNKIQADNFAIGMNNTLSMQSTNSATSAAEKPQPSPLMLSRACAWVIAMTFSL